MHAPMYITILLDKKIKTKTMLRGPIDKVGWVDVKM